MVIYWALAAIIVFSAFAFIFRKGLFAGCIGIAIGAVIALGLLALFVWGLMTAFGA